MKPRVSQLAQSSATDGQVLTWDSTNSRWQPETPSSGGSLTVQDENSNVATAVTQIDFQGAGVAVTSGTGEVVVTVAGGGGSTGDDTIHTYPSSPNAKDDEFNDASGHSGPVNGLDAQWSKHNLATSSWLVLDASKAPDALLFDLPTGQAADQSIYQAVPAGDFQVTCRVQFGGASDRQMWGPLIVDSSGNGVALLVDDPAGDGTTYLRTVGSWAQSGALTGLSGGFNNQWAVGVPWYFSLRKASGAYYAAVSAGDKIFGASLREVSGTPTAFTAAYVGFGRCFGTGTSRVALDYFRIT